MVSFQSMLQEAYRNRTAVGSFNFYNLETLKGILQAAGQRKVPVIAAFGKKYLPNMRLEEVAALTNAMASSCEVPVCLHLDHCNDLPNIFRAIRSGFTSVMYDGSALPFEENVQNTIRVCEAAHACGVSVEAELGSLTAGRDSHEGTAEDKEMYTDPDAAEEFAARTGVDALAVSIGTVHGFYRGKPNIRVDILHAINEKLHMPLVLHGGSGTPEETIRACIAEGISKINVNTEISDFVVKKSRDYLEKESPHFSVLSLKLAEFAAEAAGKYMDLFH